MKINRQAYLNEHVTWSEYYSQYVNPTILVMVRVMLGSKIMTSTDRMFNDITLAAWDKLYARTRQVVTLAEGEGWSFATSTSILKCAARMLLDNKPIPYYIEA